MTPRPLHRWKSFWFGLLVLAFLGWGWVHSMHRSSGFTCKAPGSSTIWVGHNVSGSLFIGSSGGFFDSAGLHFDSEPAGTPPSDRVWFPAAASFEMSNPYDWRWLNIAHWFLILLFLLPWTAFLLWHHHRMKRLAAEAGDPQP